MAYTTVKRITKPFGLYRQARWFNRHFLNRDELAQENSDSRFYSNFIHREDLVFDVGANYGTKTRVFLRLGARVVAFEPQADCLEELAARCGRDRRLTVVKAAVASTVGTGKFYVRGHRGLSGMIQNWEEENLSEFTVPTVTLDQMIGQYGMPVYMKIDVEGFEYEALKGLSHPVPYTSFEYHLREDDIQKAIACVQHMARLGEVAINITPAETLELAYPEWLTIERFLQVFPNDLAEKYNYRYGDIFVRVINSRV